MQLNLKLILLIFFTYYFTPKINADEIYLSLKKNIPLVNGIIVANTYDQAQTRASSNGLNKGKEITQSLIEILDL